MKAESYGQCPKDREGTISGLNAAIEALDLAKTSSTTPVETVFGSFAILLTTIRNSMVNEPDYVQLGLSCIDVCRALDLVTNGKRLDESSQSVHDAVNLLASTVADIQTKLAKRGKRNAVSRRFYARSDKETIATWRSNLDKILQAFNKELAKDTSQIVSTVRHNVVNTRAIASNVRNDAVFNIHRSASKSPKNTRGQEQTSHAIAPGKSLPPPVTSIHGTIPEIRHDVAKTRTMVYEMHRKMLKGQDGGDNQRGSTQASLPGEFAPPPPRTLFGRDELVEKIAGFAENLVPIALIGTGGIGKTSIALAVLHHHRIKQRFGNDRRFIRCNQFPISHAHLLHRLSAVIGAGIENPEDLAPLRRFLSLKEMVIVLDNAESILDPQGTDAQEIYDVVDELSQFKNIWLCITSRISTTPPNCEMLNIPTLSIEAAREAFYRIYKNGERTNVIDDILGQLDFHPLSITLLATVAHQNKWDMGRLTREWDRRRTSVLQTQHNKSLAAAIEVSLASPMFQDLGPDARGLLEVVAFFPRGVDESNIDWLFPAIPDGAHTHHRQVLCPFSDPPERRDPKLSPLLCATKERYFARMSITIGPDKHNFGESRWITSEDTNAEHLLDVFTAIDASSDDVWDACENFVWHLYWHKKRLTVLGPKIEGLPDDHHSKPGCLSALSWLFRSVGNWVEHRRLLAYVLKLWRERGSDYWIARTLVELSDANRRMGSPKEGIQLVTEALEIFGRLDETVEQARCLITLAWLMRDDNQLDAAEDAATRVVDLLPEKGEQSLVCQYHHALGVICQSKAETEKAIHHFEVALGIASLLNLHQYLFWIHYALADLFLGEGRFGDAHAHAERAKSHVANSAYSLGRAMRLRARVWYKQHKLEEARSEAQRAAEVFEELGAAKDLEGCRNLLWDIQNGLNDPVTSGQPGFDSEATTGS